MVEYLIRAIVEYKYLAVFGALSMAGFGVPVPEELTLVISGYLVATQQMVFGYALLSCYAGVLAGDVITYCLGRYAGRWVLGSRMMRWVISMRQLAQVQYYYRQYGPRSLLLSRQAPGIRFPAFFTAGMMKMPFLTFLLYDGAAALISMPLVFFLAYFFGPLGLHVLLSTVREVRNITSLVVLSTLTAMVAGYFLYRWWFRKTRDSAMGSTDMERKKESPETASPEPWDRDQ